MSIRGQCCVPAWPFRPGLILSVGAAAAQLWGPWLLLAAGGARAGAVGAVRSIFGKAVRGTQRTDLSWKSEGESQ